MGNNTQAHSTQTTTARQDSYTGPPRISCCRHLPGTTMPLFSDSLEFRPGMEPKQHPSQVNNVVQ